MLNYILSHAWIYMILIAIISLAVGSFLNVVIYRLPLMLDQEWSEECKEFLKEKGLEVDLPEKKRFNLCVPTSHCPHCRIKIKALHNIPIISYLCLYGRCAHCRKPIPVRYLLVEVLTLVLSLIAVAEFGLTAQLAVVLLLTWLLIPIIFIDLKHQIIPDSLNFSVLWLGLLANCFNLFTTARDAIIGAMIGYLFLWLVNKLFKFATKQDGMGYGDFKLLAAAGAWVGWQLLPFMVLASGILGLIIGGGYLLISRKSKTTPIPFGPFIAIALWVALLWGFDLTQAYLHLFNLGITHV